jgi:hypothetical protein
MEKTMWGYTIIGRDGGEAFMSDAEFDCAIECIKQAGRTLEDMNEGSVEIWKDDEEAIPV